MRRIPESVINQEQAQAFQKGCAIASATLHAAIKHVDDFGAYVEQPKPAPGSRGERSKRRSESELPRPRAAQPYSLNRAVGGDRQKQIAELLAQSEDLTPRQVKQGRDDIEALAVEVEKPEEKRNWKAVLDCGQNVLDLVGKATDVAHKLAPYTPAVVALVASAKHWL